MNNKLVHEDSYCTDTFLRPTELFIYSRKMQNCTKKETFRLMIICHINRWFEINLLFCRYVLRLNEEFMNMKPSEHQRKCVRQLLNLLNFTSAVIKV